MVQGILADNDVTGYLAGIIQFLEGPQWREFWDIFGLPVRAFRELSLDRADSDRLIWNVCQKEQVLLVTGNRNNDGADSLEATLRDSNTLLSLPVLTISNPKRLQTIRVYREEVAVALLDIIMNIEHHRGAGRLYLP